MRALITGGYGFAGRHLAHHLVQCGDDVITTYFPGRESPADENQLLEIPKVCQSVALDVTSATAVNDLISVLKPDVVYHLAGFTFVPDAEHHSRDVFDTNTFGIMNVLDALAKHSPQARCLVVSSAEAYGEPRPGNLPLCETSELRPISIYGVSKAAADVLAYKYSYREGLHIVRVRPFPHIGPGQNPRFAISSFAKQVAEVKLGKAKPVIQVGNLEPRRDYSDVSDIVRGYREAILNGKSGEAYNLCSGSSVEIGELLRSLIRLADVDVEIEVDPSRAREVDIADLYGSYDKAQKDFGWRPRVEREPMLDGLLAYWLEILSG